MQNKDIQKNIELLSPAGSFEGFLAALSGGADAIYLAGQEFGARAYAKNLDNEELLKAIDIAHLYGRKLYLTVNTLVKDREMQDLYDFLYPLYIQGLDGVIVQDLGVVSMIRKNFPRLPVHASTQMCICGATGAKYLSELGIKRVIPARELSLSELKALKEESGLEVECFIHGSMCYSYSGQCFLSSFFGGRSGNRGRCAGPCRLPYKLCSENKKVINEEQYILSMKDMCGIQYIPELIEAGMDSFKIEGRMKSPEYTYLITSIYRKYIDLYLQNGRKGYKILREDYDKIVGSYLRKDVCEGYFYKHNGPQMITLGKGGYNGDRDDLVIPNIKKTPISGKCILVPGQNAKLSINVMWKGSKVTINVLGEQCDIAKSSPLSADDVKGMLSKTGDTPFEFTDLSVEIDGDVFLTVKAVKDLRRKGIAKLQEMLLSGYLRRMPKDSDDMDSASSLGNFDETSEYNAKINAVVETKQQLEAVYSRAVKINAIYVESDLFLSDDFYIENNSIDIYIALPYVLRLNSRRTLERLLGSMDLASIKGFLVRGYDSLYLAKSLCPDKEIVADFDLYTFNNRADKTLTNNTNVRTTFPLELNYHEMKERGHDSELIVYGHTPMMVSANCTQKTTSQCIGDGRHVQYLSDRYNAYLPVIQNCEYCYNRILNSVPLSLHADFEQIKELKPAYIRLQFSIEDKTMCANVIDFYAALNKGNRVAMPFEDFTRGHFKKSVQ